MSTTEDIILSAGLNPTSFHNSLLQLQVELEGLAQRLQASLDPGESLDQLNEVRDVLADMLGNRSYAAFSEAFSTDGIEDLASALDAVFSTLDDEGQRSLENVKLNVDAVKASFDRLGENAFGPVEDSARSVVGHIQSAFSNFVRTGEIDFQRLATSIATSLAGIAFEEYIKEPLESIFQSLFTDLLGSGKKKGGGLIGSIVNIFGSLLSAFSGGGSGAAPKGSALGGSVTGGRPYVVGEQGRELFVPETSGRIVPNNAMGGSIIFNVQAKDADSFRRSESQIAAMLHRVASRGSRNL